MSTSVFAAENPAVKPLPPSAKKLPKAIVTHGDERVDDYFWLREKSNPEVLAYLEAENTYADAVTAPLAPARETLYKEMLGHLKQTDVSAPVRRKDFWYYSRTEEGKNYGILCRKFRSLDAKEEIILDQNALAEGTAFFSIGAAALSDDNNYLAYTTDTNGYRQYTLQVKDLRTGKLLPEKFERVDDVIWGTDNQTLFFVTEDAVTKRHDTFLRHRLGGKAPERIYFEPDELYDISAERSRDRKFVFITSESKLSTEVRFFPTERPAEAPKIIEPRGTDHKYFAAHRNGLFYLRTNDRAKNYRIATASPEAPGKSSWKEFVPHNAAVKLDDLNLFAGHAVLSEREDGLERLRMIDLASNDSHVLQLPEPTYDLSIDENPEFDTHILRFRYQSMVTPNSVFDYDMPDRKRTLVKETEVPGFKKENYLSERIFVTAKDGVQIPCSVVYRRGTERTGKNPLMLYGYGSYGHSLTATFSFSRLALLDRGIIYVIAHIRGGGEMGELWRDQGRMMAKTNTFTDFIACAEHLIQQKYTAPDRLAIQGGSAGGLLVGAVVNMRPELFKVAIAHVPFVDVLNTMLDASLPLTTSEYIEWGNPNEKAAYDFLKTYSPYDNVRKQNYPTMLIRVSLNDSQVPYWEGAKWAARLRATKSDSNLVLLKTNLGGGHGGASGRYDALRDLAFDYAFLLDQFGVKR